VEDVKTLFHAFEAIKLYKYLAFWALSPVHQPTSWFTKRRDSIPDESAVLVLPKSVFQHPMVLPLRHSKQVIGLRMRGLLLRSEVKRKEWAML